LLFIIEKLHLLIVENPFSKSKKVFNVDDKYNYNKTSEQTELGKINKKGYNTLRKKKRN
jgi:hypothetical protein